MIPRLIASMAPLSLRRFITQIFTLSFLLLTCSAKLPDGRPHGNMIRPPTIPIVSLGGRANLPVVSQNGTELPPYETVYYFDQLIDHDRPSLGTFQQRYWFTYEFYRPGGPIILLTPGEVNAEPFSGYLTNQTMSGRIAQRQNGSTVVLEHRFYGLSNPYPDLSATSFRVHTIQQAIEDLEYFAKNVILPMPNGDKVTPDKAPWILVGGSYAGALVSWTMVSTPGVFFAGYSSSGVIQAKLDFWEYFEPIRQYMPNNCSSDVQAVVSHLDEVFRAGNQTAIQELKESFGLGELMNDEDLLSALRNNLWDWQLLQPNTGPNTRFYKFCDALEIKDGEFAPDEGWGVEHALSAWADYWRRRYYLILCGTEDAERCLGTHNATLDFWTDTSINNAWRSWFWIVCNEVGYLQNGAPDSNPSLVSRLIQPPYDLRQCQLMFPTAFSSTPQPKASIINQKYQGWDVKVDRVIFVDGARDPWRDATISARSRRPVSTALQPIHVTDGFHCSDLGITAGTDQTIADAQQKSFASINAWLKTWKPRKGPYHPHKPHKPSRPSPRPHRPHPFKKGISAWLRGAGQL